MSNDEAIEAKIKELGLDAPRVTPDRIAEVIVSEEFHVFPGSQLTVCCITLLNGFTVTGTSACASPENFNKEMGETIAKRNAKDQIWALEGYLLKQELYDNSDKAYYDKVISTAKMCHEVNASICRSFRDFSQTSWEDAPMLIKKSAMEGVKFHVLNPEASPEDCHVSWYNYKKAEGWTYGEIKDLEKKVHPNMVAYDKLSEADKVKDYVFKQVVGSLM